MNLKPLVFAALAACVPSLAFASQSAFAEFKLDVLPALAFDSTTSPASSTVGHWTDANYTVATSIANWEVDGSMLNEHSQSSELQNIDPGSKAGAPFGKGTLDWSGTQSNEHGMAGKAQADVGLIRADVSLSRTDLAVKGDTQVLWSRKFELNPHASVTLSGLISLSTGLGEPATDYYYSSLSTSATLDFSTISYAGGTDYAGVRLSGDLDEKDISVNGEHLDASAFSYSMGPDGHLALTLTNSSDSVMEGSFTASLYAMASTPTMPTSVVPEPQTWLMLGLGVLSIAARKNSKRSTTVA